MRVLVVHAHPVEESFNRALFTTVVETLTAGGHEVRPLDLYAEGFEPALSDAERRRYDDVGGNTGGIEDHVAHIQWAEALVFVYPTWWYGLPAMLKGWLDRVWVPGVAFLLPPDGKGPIQGGLPNIRWVVGVSTYGAPWWWTRWVGDPGRRTILRGLKPLCHHRVRSRWFALYLMDTASEAKRERFLARVRHAFERF